MEQSKKTRCPRAGETRTRRVRCAMVACAGVFLLGGVEATPAPAAHIVTTADLRDACEQSPGTRSR
jgi:hypothetical protein